jgi:hypothetical protein
MPELIAQFIAAVFSLLAGGAWVRSAMLDFQPLKKAEGVDMMLDRISRNPRAWNAIAAFLAAGAAIAQAIVFLLTMPG